MATTQSTSGAKKSSGAKSSATTKKASSGAKSTASKTAKSDETKTKKAAPKSASKSASARTTAKSAPKKAAPKKPAAAQGQSVKRFDGKTAKEPMAIAFLMQQHREVEGYFAAYERAKNDEEKQELSHRICMALKVHAQIEEELFYPEAHEKLNDEDIVDEAIVEHASAKDLIAQIESMSVGEHLYDAKVTVLGEYIKHHVQEEETEMFPEAKKAGMDLEAIGERLQQRSEELMRMMEAGQEPGGRTRSLLDMFRGSEAGR